ncbi:MAG: NAD(P)/FAD-dependent oxidoreductase [Calditrichaeota bacterium]|nr:MAG: NAD(P)/FAD-dependent oxidoreductase [Calditrichota bacterium]
MNKRADPYDYTYCERTDMKVSIIGAGIGGLTLANYLTQQGHQVTLFEAHSSPGGYTAGFRRHGFYFESGTLSFESGSMVFKAMEDLGVRDKIRFVPQKSRWMSPRFDGAPENWEQFKELLLNAYPEEQAGLTQYFRHTEPLIKMMTALQPPASFKQSLAIPFKLAQFMRYFYQYKNVTITDFTGRFFTPSSPLYNFLKELGYPDMSAWLLGGAIYTLFYDYYTVEDGMQSWADVLAEAFRQRGGTLRLKTPVERILTENGRAVGVMINGERLSADIVVSAMDYKKTFLQLLDHPELLAADLHDKIANTAVSEGIFTVYLGLNIPHSRFQQMLKLPHVLFNDGSFGADVHNSHDADYFQKASLSLYSPSLMNASLAPRDKSSLMISAVAPYRWMNNWGGGVRAEYESLKKRVTSVLLERAAKLLPDISNAVEFVDAATPLTYERYTGNSDGATSAFSWNPHKRFYKNMISAHIDTPVKNLYIGSCWSSQIGGVPGAIGAAQKIAKRLGSGK